MVMPLLKIAASLLLFVSSFSLAVAVTTNDDNVFDFIVIGGGTAGCVLTTRLCQSLPHAKIAILEQGAERTTEQDLRTRALGLTRELSLGYEPLTIVHLSEPNQALFDADITNTSGRIISMYEMKSMGGGSNVAWQWEIPLNGTYETWGIEGFDSETGLAAMAKAAQAIQPQQPPASLQYTYAQDILDAYESAGFDVLDTAGPKGSGGKTAYLNVVPANPGGERQTSWTSYLQPALMNECAGNVHLIQGAFVSKILISPSSETNNTVAEGVEFINTNGQTETIMATREVLVSAGPFGTPRLLQLSGIGDGQVLRDAGVDEIVVDLPVGLKTLVRPIGIVPILYTGVPLFPEVNVTSRLSNETIQQFNNGEGGLLGFALSSVIGKVGDVGFHTVLMSLPGADNQPLLAGACILNAKSTGNITIKTSNPTTELSVHSNLLEGNDFADMISCVRQVTEAYVNLTSTLGAAVLAPLDVENFAGYISASTETSWHVVGASRPGEVIDGATFKVLGFENLRICDASVMPEFPVSAGPLTSVYALSEFLSDKMVAEYKNEYGADSSPTQTPTDSPTQQPMDFPTQTPTSGVAKVLTFSFVLITVLLFGIV
eukprot:scaffold7692_cov163-Amphora_coffeaeformis.AAC.9